jgi:hypothetical protein
MLTLSLITLSSATLMVAAQPTADPIAPAQGNTQEFVFVRPTAQALGVVVKETHDLTLQSLTSQFGEEAPQSVEVAMRLRTRLDAALAEEVIDAGAGANALRRRYLSLEGEIQVVDPGSVNEEEGTWDGVGLPLQSPFEGLSVVFQPAASQPDGHGRHFDGRALRESALPSLAVPTDWSTFLPPSTDSSGVRKITLGDTWKVDPARLEPLLAPSGFLGWRTVKKDKKEGGQQPESSTQVLRAFASGVGGNLHLAFDGELEGEATAKLVTVGVDPDHGRYGEFNVEFSINLAANRNQFVQSRRIEGEGELDVDVVGGDLTVRLAGAAVIKWGIDTGRPFAALVAADEDVMMTVRVQPETGDAVSQTIQMQGSVANGLTFRERPLAPIKRTVVEGK